MLNIMNNPHELFTPEKAIAYAAAAKAGDPDWDYVPNHCPKGTGLSFIEVFDEDGEKVGEI